MNPIPHCGPAVLMYVAAALDLCASTKLYVTIVSISFARVKHNYSNGKFYVTKGNA